MRTEVVSSMFLVCLFGVPQAFGQASQSPKAAVQRIRECPGTTSQAETTCEDDVYLLTHVYKRGNTSVLKPLLDVGLKSDGALSEDLGVFYSGVLLRSTRSFVSKLAVRPVIDQKRLYRLAIWADGGGNTRGWSRKVRANLRLLKGNRRFVESVALCLKLLAMPSSSLWQS